MVVTTPTSPLKKSGKKPVSANWLRKPTDAFKKTYQEWPLPNYFLFSARGRKDTEEM